MKKRIIHLKRRKKKLSQYFSKGIFWDCDMDNLDIELDADFIIPRVLNKGSVSNSLEKLNVLYPLEQIQFYCRNSKEIYGNENIEELSDIFNLKPEEFVRYMPSLGYD